jgi:hypothetical protein
MLKSPAGWMMGVVGAGFASASLFVAMAVGGAGHGWVTPFFVSLGTAIFFPISFFRLGVWRRTQMPGNIIMLIIGAFAVIALFAMTVDEGTRYFRAVGSAAWLWIGIWSNWILAALITALLRGLNKTAVPS